MENQDLGLLQKYQNSGSELAFAAIVSRHIDLVYSVALRQVRDTDMAREICQLVFIKLSEKAHALDSRIILSGWLCRTARFICADYLKAHYRRERREKEYVMQNHPTEPEADIWETLSPCVDAALAQLDVADQDLLILRFFEKKQFASLGLDLGISDAAAKMRVARALEKLRKILASKGVVLTFAALAASLMTNAVRAVPPEVLAQILNHLKSSPLPPHLPQPHRSHLQRVGMPAAICTILLLTGVAVMLHSSLAKREDVGSAPITTDTAQKHVPGASAETSVAQTLGATGVSTNESLVANGDAQPILTPYAPKVFSEDTDDMQFILEYVEAQLRCITLADGAGDPKPLQVGILGDSRYIGQTSKFIHGASAKRATDLKDLDDCSIILLALENEDQIKDALTALAERPVITIGLSTNFLVWGGCINFMTLDNILTFGLNMDRAKTIGCHFSDVLTNAAAELFENGTQVCRFAARPGDDTELEFFEKKNPFLPKGFTRRMKRLALSEAKRAAIIDAWRQYPVEDTFVSNPLDMRDAMQEQQREIEALRKSGSMSFEAMTNIFDKFNAKADKVFSSAMDSSVKLDSMMRETRPKRLGLLSLALTPEELFGYRFLLDSEASKVANTMRVINITSDELRRIAFVFDEHAEGMTNGSFSPETDAKLQQELGPARYAEFRAAYSPAGRELTYVILKYSNPLAHRTFFGTARIRPKQSY